MCNLIDYKPHCAMDDLIELKKASIERIEPDVLVTRYKDGVGIALEDAKEIDQMHQVMSKDDDMFVVNDLTYGGVSINNEAVNYFVSKSKMIPNLKGVATISNKKSNFLKGLFSRTPKPLYPAKEFITFEDAYDWFAEIRLHG